MRRRLARIATGVAEVVLIEGEPGIGKSHFLDELLSDPAGLRSFRADADEFDRVRPFAPLASALGCRRAAPDRLRAEIAGLIDEGAAEFRIVERFAELLEVVSLEGPVLVAIDDLQWADVSTLTALRFAHRHLHDVPVSFVLAHRPVPPGSDLASFLAASIGEGAVHLSLGPLADEDVCGLVEHIAGRPPGPRLRSLLASAAGNPFYVTEAVQAFATDGRLDLGDGLVDVGEGTRLPASFSGSVVRYLRFLDESHLSLLRWAAVLGSRFSAVNVATVSGEPIDVVLNAIEHAAQLGMVIPEEEDFAFRHDLVHEALYEMMRAPVRASRHLAAGRALAGAGAAASDVAYHFARAPAVEDDLAVASLVEAARGAINLKARAELLDAALRRLSVRDERAVDVAVEAIGCLGAVGRIAEAEAIAAQFRPHVPAGGVARLRAALASAYVEQNDPARVLHHCAAIRNDPSLAPGLRAGLQATEGFALLMAGRLDDARAAGRRAVEEGALVGDPGAVLAGRGLLCLSALAAGQSRNAAAMAAENVEVWPSEYGTIILQMTLHNEDRLGEITELFHRSRERFVENGYLIGLPALQANSGLALLLAGNLDDAQVDAEAGLLLAEQMGVQVINALARGVLGRIAVHRGLIAEAEAVVSQSGHVPELGGGALLETRALIHLARGDINAARDTLGAAWSSSLRPIGSGIGPDLVRLHLLAQDRDRAAAVAADVERDASGSDGPSAAGAALRCRALIRNDSDLMRQAIACYERGPRALETAATREDAATLLGTSEAVEQLTAALSAYEAAGASGDVIRVRAALRKRGVRLGARGPRQRPSSGWDSLTPAERRVADLAADGLTTRQIGDRLFISSFTVGSHLRHIYQKLSINSRLQLAAEVRRHSPEELA